MKFIVTELNDSNEQVMFHKFILGNYKFNTYFENISADVSSLDKSYKKFKVLHCTYIVKLHCNIVDCISTNVDIDTNNCFSFSSNENNDLIQDFEEYIRINIVSCISMVNSTSLQNFNIRIDKNHLD